MDAHEKQTSAAEAAAAPEEPRPHGDALLDDEKAESRKQKAEGEGERADAVEAAEEQAVEHDIEELLERAGKAEEYLALAQRTQADFENYRKRMARETTAAEARGIARLAKELLPAIDNLTLAVAAAEAHEGLAEGFRLVEAELTAALARAGIQAYSPEGEPFDPNEHEAMSQREVEGAEPGTVVDVFQRGYRVDGMVLRPARVVVAA
jgi:molecular chaperone GrpE